MIEGLCTMSGLNVFESVLCLDSIVRIADVDLIFVEGVNFHMKARGLVFAPVFRMTPPAFDDPSIPLRGERGG